MEKIEIKITGSGTINQVGIAVHTIARMLLNDPEDVTEGTYEDSIIITEITEDPY